MTLQDLIDHSPGEFEIFVTNLLRKMGYKAETTQLTADGGIDVWASNDNLFSGGKIIVQCKRYSEHQMVGEPVLRELFGLVHAHGVNKGVLVTTSSFTRGAVKFAEGKPIELLGGLQLLGLCQQANFEVPAGRFAWFDVGDEHDTLKYLDEWNGTDPLPYPLRFSATSNELLTKVDVWNLDGQCEDIGYAILRVDYFLAANHLLQGSIFRPEPIPVDFGVWSRQQISLICRSYSRWRETHRDEAKLQEAEMAESETAEHRIEFSISAFEGFIQPLCLKFWWKAHKPTHKPTLYDYIREK
ncbi:MAG: hypothetical protein DMG96_41915 [Acidobacteria bacterium]|nr:MAG: hypothetical protein DMG96_41915 [Acidobacteriota bacterium]